jgi:hypothetical protein
MEKQPEHVWEMAGTVSIKETGKAAEIKIDTGTSLEHYSLPKERFVHVKELAEASQMPVDVFIDQAVRKFGFGKDLFEKILTEKEDANR